MASTMSSPGTDYERHNAEVDAVWEAFRSGRPERVPCVVGTNSRYFLLGERAPLRGISFERYFADPELMFTTQLRMDDFKRHHILQDAPMGLPKESDGWSVFVDLQNVYEAAWFGCEIRYVDGQVPDTVPCLADDAKKRGLFERGIPNAFSGLMAKNREYYELFVEKAKSHSYKARRVAHVHPAGMGTDGPLTVAVSLRGATELFEDLSEDPDYVHELLDFVTDATIARILAWREYLGLPAKQDHFWFADDACQMISERMYRTLVMPRHRRIREALGVSQTGGGIHLCGDATHHFRTIRDELGIDEFDTGFPVDFAALRRELGPNVLIQGGPNVSLLLNGTPSSVVRSAREVLSSGVMRGGRFILREGNNLAPDTPLENVAAMHEAARRFGRYSSEPAAA
jgi:uroporphyrinogen-III decarboxylase